MGRITSKVIDGYAPKSRLRSSSILEVVVAMVAIVTVLGIALTIYSNVVRSSLSAKQLKAQAVLDKRMEILAHAVGTTQTDTLTEGWHLQQQIDSYQGNERLRQVHLLLLDGNQDTIAQLRQVIINRNYSSSLNHESNSAR